jgi:hypothetical protein
MCCRVANHTSQPCTENCERYDSAFEKIVSDTLLGNLELSGFNNFSVTFPQLIDVDAAVVFIQVDGSSRRNIFLFVNHLAKEIIHLDVVTLLITFLQIKSDKRSGRIRIELNNPVSNILWESP